MRGAPTDLLLSPAQRNPARRRSQSGRTMSFELRQPGASSPGASRLEPTPAGRPPPGIRRQYQRRHRERESVLPRSQSIRPLQSVRGSELDGSLTNPPDHLLQPPELDRLDQVGGKPRLPAQSHVLLGTKPAHGDPRYAM